MSQPILVTGATGMIGTALIGALLRSSPDNLIRAFYRNTPPSFQDPRVEYLQGDLTSREDCRRAARGCRRAVMAAAETAGAAANRNLPQSFLTDNLVMNALLLEQLCEAGVSRVVLLSSSMVYPDCSRPITEDDLDLNLDPPAAFFGVGWALRSVEKIARFWHRQASLQVAVVRLSNVYGPFARFDPARSNFIPALLRKALAGDDPLEVWGSPDVVRDVLYVDDCCEAVVRLLGHPEVAWAELNLGSGIPRRVGEVVSAVLEVTGRTGVPVVYRRNAPTTTPYRVLEIGRLRGLLDWEPRFSLHEGLSRTARWWMARRDRWPR